jgi:hypothetical protein
MAASPTRVRLKSASAHAKALKIFPAFVRRLSRFSRVFLCRLFIQIIGFLLFRGLGVLDALMEDAAENLDKAASDLVQVF